MITSLLENMIHEGRATYRNFVGALCGVYVLNVPKDNYIIIHDIYTHDFCDAGFDAGFLTNNDRINQRIQISSTNGARLNLLNRANLQGFKNGVTDVVSAQGLKHYCVYSIHAGTVRIDYSVLPANGELNVVDFTPPPDQVGEDPSLSLGYGNSGAGINTAKEISIAGATPKVYNPLTTEFYNTFFPTNIEQYTPLVKRIETPSFAFLGSSGNNAALPLFNIGYTHIYEPLPKALKF